MPNIDQWASEQLPDPPKAARSTPTMQPAPAARLHPVRVSASIVHPDLTLPAALDPEVIRLDKWIPVLCEMHH